MKKLLTTGCSYTSYYYPTWADWLGVYFDKHINLGVSGSGPRYSYTALNDFFRYKKNNPKDYIVIVQWSSLLRHDKRNPETGHWYWGGQIDNNINYNEDYLKKFYKHSTHSHHPTTNNDETNFLSIEHHDHRG